MAIKPSPRLKKAIKEGKTYEQAKKEISGLSEKTYEKWKTREKAEARPTVTRAVVREEPKEELKAGQVIEEKPPEGYVYRKTDEGKYKIVRRVGTAKEERQLFLKGTIKAAKEREEKRKAYEEQQARISTGALVAVKTPEGKFVVSPKEAERFKTSALVSPGVATKLGLISPEEAIGKPKERYMVTPKVARAVVNQKVLSRIGEAARSTIQKVTGAQATVFETLTGMRGPETFVSEGVGPGLTTFAWTATTIPAQVGFGLETLVSAVKTRGPVEAAKQAAEGYIEWGKGLVAGKPTAWGTLAGSIVFFYGLSKMVGKVTGPRIIRGKPTAKPVYKVTQPYGAIRSLQVITKDGKIVTTTAAKKTLKMIWTAKEKPPVIITDQARGLYTILKYDVSRVRSAFLKTTGEFKWKWPGKAEFKPSATVSTITSPEVSLSQAWKLASGMRQAGGQMVYLVETPALKLGPEWLTYKPPKIPLPSQEFGPTIIIGAGKPSAYGLSTWGRIQRGLGLKYKAWEWMKEPKPKAVYEVPGLPKPTIIKVSTTTPSFTVGAGGFAIPTAGITAFAFESPLAKIYIPKEEMIEKPTEYTRLVLPKTEVLRLEKEKVALKTLVTPRQKKMEKQMQKQFLKRELRIPTKKEAVKSALTQLILPKERRAELLAQFQPLGQLQPLAQKQLFKQLLKQTPRQITRLKTRPYLPPPGFLLRRGGYRPSRIKLALERKRRFRRGRRARVLPTPDLWAMARGFRKYGRVGLPRGPEVGRMFRRQMREMGVFMQFPTAPELKEYFKRRKKRRR